MNLGVGAVLGSTKSQNFSSSRYQEEPKMIWACVLGPRFDGQLSHGLPTLALCPLPKLRRHWPECQSLRNRSLRLGRLQRVASFFGARPLDGSKTTFDGCLKYYLTNLIYFV